MDAEPRKDQGYHAGGHVVGNGNSARKEFPHPIGVTTEQHYEQEQQMQINGAGSEDATGQQA